MVDSEVGWGVDVIPSRGLLASGNFSRAYTPERRQAADMSEERSRMAM